MLQLRRERENRGWSLAAVCMRTGISPSDLSLIERGHRPAYPGWRKRIAEAFDLPEAELFQEVEDD
jgi:transcriptional regulator with XRE-family HTH domain